MEMFIFKFHVLFGNQTSFLGCVIKFVSMIGMTTISYDSAVQWNNMPPKGDRAIDRYNYGFDLFAFFPCILTCEPTIISRCLLFALLITQIMPCAHGLIFCRRLKIGSCGPTFLSDKKTDLSSDYLSRTPQVPGSRPDWYGTFYLASD